MDESHPRAHFPLSVWQLYLQGAVGVALGRLVPIGENLALARSRLRMGSRSYADVKTYESLKWSLILQCFATLELVANGLIQTSLGLHDTVEWKPLTPRGLTRAQLAQLGDGGWIWMSTVEKLRLAPDLLSTLYHRQARIDWGELGWQAIRQLRRTRHRLVHVKLADARKLESRFKAQRQGRSDFMTLNLAEIVEPEVGIPDNAVWDALAGLGWYLRMVDRIPGFGKNTYWRTNWVFRKNALLHMAQGLDQIWGTPRTKMRSYTNTLLTSWVA